MSSIDSLISILLSASKAYYESETPIMSDEEYDELVERLRALDPTNAFFTQVGFQPSNDVVKLPVPMPSLDKKKPDTLKDGTLSGNYLLSEKLDGISALWVCGLNTAPALYLRGNGSIGQNVSHCIKGIQGLTHTNLPICMVRGELICPKSAKVCQGTLARNWVNGILHQKSPSLADLNQIHFVAYQLCEPALLTRQNQMTWLQNKGFEVAWNQTVFNPDCKVLEKAFQDRRLVSAYECDGIVVGKDAIPDTNANKTCSNPKDAFAFKMPLDDQRAVSVVEEVEWASSRTGNWIPRIRFQPVIIGTATIQYCTGFHAQHIQQNSIGPGAKVLIRRSGDVIPTLEKVLEPAPGGWSAPPEGRWVWDATGVHAIDTTQEATPEKLALEMTHTLVNLGVEGISKVSAKKLVEAGIRDCTTLYKTPVEKLQSAIGSSNGQKLFDGVRLAIENATQDQWVRAYTGWPKGFGETRIAAVLAIESNIVNWVNMTPPKGQSKESFNDVCKAVPGFLEWRSKFPNGSKNLQSTTTTSSVTAKGNYVMSGFRDPVLQDQLKAAGWTYQDRITKTTTILLVPDDAKETVKIQDARKAGIRIIKRGDVASII